MDKRFYITTAIDYVNGQPHLGHAYEKVIADVIARARRLLGEPVFFLTGLDEHGQKVQQAAQAEGKQPQQYCDELALSWQSVLDDLRVQAAGGTVAVRGQAGRPDQLGITDPAPDGTVDDGIGEPGRRDGGDRGEAQPKPDREPPERTPHAIGDEHVSCRAPSTAMT